MFLLPQKTRVLARGSVFCFQIRFELIICAHMSSPEFSYTPENKAEPEWKKKIGELLKQFDTKTLESDVKKQALLQESVDKREKKIADREVLDVLKEYGISTDGIEVYENNEVDAEIEYQNEDIYKVKVKNHFSDQSLPEGYGYKGGTARALLLRSLGIDPSYEPRDIDVVRTSKEESFPGQDAEVSRKFMPDDFASGYGVEVMPDINEYLESRDLTINEVLATDTEIVVSKKALLDTVRHILRVTPFERYRYSSDGDIGPKILSKLLRFYSESIHRYGEAQFQDIYDWEFEQNFIGPFWLALQLDRAMEVSSSVAEQYIQEIKTKNLIPEKIKSIEDAVEYLSGKLQADRFYFRHAPIKQFASEYEWIGEKYQKLPKQRGHSKSRGEK